MPRSADCAAGIRRAPVTSRIRPTPSWPAPKKASSAKSWPLTESGAASGNEISIASAAPVQAAGVIRMCGERRMTISDPARLKATASAIRPPAMERSWPRSEDIISVMPTMTPAMAT